MLLNMFLDVTRAFLTSRNNAHYCTFQHLINLVKNPKKKYYIENIPEKVYERQSMKMYVRMIIFPKEQKYCITAIL